MPVAQLKFKLPEEETEFFIAANGEKWKGLLFDVVEKLRKIRKHEENQDRNNLADELIDEIYNGMDHMGLYF